MLRSQTSGREKIPDSFGSKDPVADVALEEDAALEVVDGSRVAGPDLQLVGWQGLLSFGVVVRPLVVDQAQAAPDRKIENLSVNRDQTA